MIEPAADLVLRRNGQHGRCLSANFHGKLATWQKSAACWSYDQVWRLAFDRMQPLSLLARNRHGLEQTGCVRVTGRGIQFLNRRRLDNLSGIHDKYFVAHAGDNSKIVRNQDDCSIELLIQFFEQFKNLCLYSYVQSSRWFIGK